MSDFFGRLAQRAMGLAKTVRPILAPLIAPEPRDLLDAAGTPGLEQLEEMAAPTPTIAPTMARGAVSQQVSPISHPASSEEKVREIEVLREAPGALTNVTAKLPADDNRFQRLLDTHPAIEGVEIAEPNVSLSPAIAAFEFQPSATEGMNVHARLHEPMQARVRNTAPRPHRAPPQALVSRAPRSAAPVHEGTPDYSTHDSVADLGVQVGLVEQRSRARLSAPSRRTSNDVSAAHEVRGEEGEAAVRIVIGRIDVRAPEPPQNRTPVAARVPFQSLDNYLEQRSRRKP